MATVVGGQGTGILDTSLFLLNRGDPTGNADTKHGDAIFVNVSNGNLVVQHTDLYLPSRGEDSLLTRTYNARGVPTDTQQGNGTRWSGTPFIRLDERQDNNGTYFEMRRGDGTLFLYRFNADSGLYESNDGVGAFETLEDLNVNKPKVAAYVITRADQTRLEFDKSGRIIRSVDTNGNEILYEYQSSRLATVRDDTGHVIHYEFDGNKLVRVVDETEGAQVEYRYEGNQLVEVIDRMGHSTQYFYTNNGYLERIVLPEAQDADNDGVLETYDRREIRFEYEQVNWGGGGESFNDNRGQVQTLTRITDADGQVTTFDYDLQIGQDQTKAVVIDRRGSSTRIDTLNNNGKGPGNGKDPDPSEDKFFQGGTTRVVDALGNARAFSNEQEYQDWRVENGFYTTYDDTLEEGDAGFDAQQAAAESIRDLHAVVYLYNGRSFLTEVIDQQGFHTFYEYDEQDNLTAVTDRNAWGTTTSDSAYYRELRAELGYTDVGGAGKLVADLTETELDELREAYTTHFEYDERGNLTRRTDNEDNVTSFTYTDFNKVETTTAAMGHALTTRDEQLYQDKRVELGYAALAADLSNADKDALLALYTTQFSYDGNQNLVETVDPGGDITRYEYDVYGNRTKTIVFLDANNLTDPAKQQVSIFQYDIFGNLSQSTNGEGDVNTFQYDHYGNLLRTVDGNGGETLFTYDMDNRLLTVTDPEGFTTTNAYDAVGNKIAVTDANGHTITRVYDLNDRLITTIAPHNNNPSRDRVTQFDYDVVGSNTKVVDGEGRETTYVFDTRRQLVETITPEVVAADGTTLTRYSSTYKYDGEQNLITSTNNRGFMTEVLYDQNGLLLQSTDPIGQVTRYQYDANLNVVLITAGQQLEAAKRQIVRFSFDEEDQLVRETDAEGGATVRTFDAPGNVSSITDANGNRTDFEFDRANRLVREIRPEVTDPVTGLPTRYVVETRYDGNGNAVEVINENGVSSTYSFDRNDRLILAEDGNGVKTVFEYDGRGNTTKVLIGVEAALDTDGNVVVTDVDDAQVTTNRYNVFNELVAIVDGVGNALAESNAPLYQALRQDLNFPALAEDLSNAQKALLRSRHTTRFTYDRVGNLVTERDNLNRLTTFDYDALNRVVERIDATGRADERSTLFRYDGNGNQVGLTDAEGRITSLAYDANDRLTDVTDPLGIRTRTEYDTFGNVIADTQAFGTTEARRSEFVYDLNNRLLSETDPLGNTRSVKYDAVGNRIKLTDGRGKSTEFHYDALDRNIKIIDPLSFETNFEYDGAGNQISLIDARGGITRFDYDPGNRQIRLTDAEGRITEFDYDVRGNIVVRTTGVGTTGAGSLGEEVTTFVYDAENNLRSVTDAKGNVDSNVYDRVYNLIETTDRNGNVTTTRFDALNRAILVTNALGNTTSFAYDAVDNLLTQTDELGRVTTFEYDANDRRISQTDADGVETRFTYDQVANTKSITRAFGTPDAATTSFVYDLDDRLVEEIDALGNSTTYTYDPEDNVKSSTDPEGNTTRFRYDDAGQLVRIIDAEDNVVRYAYDGNGNRTQVIDGRDNATTTYYNANDEVSLVVDAEGYAFSSEYDAQGNVIRQTLFATALTTPVDPATEPTPATSPDDQVTQFVYDELNRLVTQISGEGFEKQLSYDAVGNVVEIREEQDLAGTIVAVTRSYFDRLNREIARITPESYLTGFEYDAVGNQTATVVYNDRVAVPPAGSLPTPPAGDPGKRTTFEYNVVNLLVRETNAAGTVTEYDYDLRGNQTTVDEAVGSAVARTTTFAYDKADRLIQTTYPDGTSSRLTLDANGFVIERRDAFGTPAERVTVFAYDDVNNLVREEVVGQAGSITTFGYDAAQNLITKTSAVGLPEERVERFEYDKNNRKVRQEDGNGDPILFEYDAAGNETRVVESPGLAAERDNNSQYNRDNRLVAFVNGNGDRTEYEYDGQGNRTASIQFVGDPPVERRTEYEYDLENRLVKVISPEGTVTEYVYDVLGNAVQEIDGNGGVSVRTFDDQGRLLAELTPNDVLFTLTYDSLGNLISRTQGFASTATAATFRSTGAPPANPAFTGGTRTETFAYDTFGRVVDFTDGEGFTTRTQYDAFGNQTKILRGLYLLNQGDPGYDPQKAQLGFDVNNAPSLSYTYDQLNRITSTIDGEGNVTEYEYDGNDNRTKEVDARGVALSTSDAQEYQDRRVALGYDALVADLSQQDIAEIRDLFARTYTYDLAGNITSITSAEGGVKEFSDYVNGEAETVRTLQSGVPGDPSAVWITETFQYDGNGNQTVAVDGRGFRTERTFDANNNKLSETIAAGTADERTTTFEYNLDNYLVATTDAEGNRTEFGRDALGNRTFVTDALNRTAHFFYFPGSNNLRAVVDGEGYVNEFEYDAANNRTEVRVYLDKYTGPLDNYVSPSQPADRVISTTYDSADNITTATLADGQVINYLNDAAGRMLERETVSSLGGNNPAVRTETFTYDKNNRLVTATEVDGTVSTLEYDEVNNKIRETVVAAPGYGTPNPNGTRINEFEYDANNRLTAEIVDPGGLNIRQSLEYDKIGNVVKKIDANGTDIVSSFNLNNELITVVVDPTGLTLTSRFTYDGAGNQVTMTDALLNTANFEYDLNNRLVREILPAVTTFDVANDVQTGVRPTTVNTYDAVGNLVQITDANGNKTTRYYNNNDQLVAEIRGDNSLVEFDYNGANELVEERLYMNLLSETAQNPSVRPTAPSGDVRVTNRQYDDGGRLLRVINPAMEVTTLSIPDTDPGNPVATTSTYRPQEFLIYNGFGEVIETYDRNAIGNQSTTNPLNPADFADENNRHINYFDAKGRVVATVNAEGFLTEWDYDAQDNLVEQRQYATALVMSQVDSATRPDPVVEGLGTPETVLSTYDKANRLISQSSGLFDALTVDVNDPSSSTTANVRQVTSYTYDDLGNETSRTRAAGTAEALTEYLYYDAAGRQVALVDAYRVLSTYQYDAVGNQTELRRYFHKVDNSVNLPTADLTELRNGVTESNTEDQVTRQTFDAAGRLLSTTDRMVIDTDADDLTQSFSYDANGNRTKAVDEANFVRLTGYDGQNRSAFSESPDGSGSFVLYNAAGEAVKIWTGEVENAIIPSTVNSVQLDNVDTSSTADDLFQLGWSVSGPEVQSYVIYGESSNTSVNPALPFFGYTGQSGIGSNYGDTAGSAGIPTSGFTPGERLYYRIVSVDKAQNIAWSSEQSVLVPPRFSDVRVSQPASNQIRVQVTFDADPPAGTVQLVIPGQTAVTMTDLGNGVHAGTATVVGDPKALSYQVQWQDTEGTTYTSQTVPLAAADTEIGTYTTISETSGVSLTTKIDAGAVESLVVRGRTDSSTGWTSLGETSPSSTSGGVDVFNVNVGTLASGPYQVQLRGVLADGRVVVLDRFDLAVGSSDGLVFQSLSWSLPEVGDDPDVGDTQLVVIDGQQVGSTRDTGEGRLLVDSTVTNGTSDDFAVFYGQSTGTSHNVTVDQRLVSESFDDDGDTKYRVKRYRLTVDATNLPTGAQVAWRAASSGIDFSNFVDPGQEFTVVSSGSLPRDFDIKVFYVDGDGNEVIVDWRRVTVDGPDIGAERNNDPAGTTELVDETTESFAVLARETDGTVTRGAGDDYTFTRGLYTGPVSDETVLQPIDLTQTPSTGAGTEADEAAGGGLNAGYFIENEYDANGNQIATNQDTGIWRRFGVDANGNQVATYAYGTKEAEDANATPITTFTKFNNRNFETGEYGASVAFDADGNGTEESTGREITEFVRDFLDRVVLETTPLGTTIATQYNALGLVTSEVATSAGELSRTTKAYDILGNLARETDGKGNSVYKVYDGTRLITDIDALGAQTQYQYDSLGRHTGTTTPGIQTSTSGTTQTAQYTMTYDQRDRLTNVNDGLGFDTQYGWDGRDNRITVIDANGNTFGTEYDEMNRVEALTSTQNGVALRETRDYDFFSNLTSETDAEGRTRYTTYGAFGRRLSTTDEGGRVTNLTYDDFGRLLTRIGVDSGQDITNTYDDAGRLKSITDASTNVSTTYTYDVDGNRSYEAITTPGNAHNRTVSYGYDGLGRMTSWSDSTQGKNLSYQYDMAGNLRRVSGSNGTNHWYFYDENNRQEAKADGPDLSTATKDFSYTYDAAGNRISENSTSYAYDLNSRVVAAGTSVSWTYDKVGNVLTFTSGGDTTTYEYYENNRQYSIDDGGAETVTTLTLDDTGRVLTTVIVDSSGDDPTTSTFNHTYSDDGRELSVSGSGGGDSAGSTSLTYNANDNVTTINLGKGDLQAQAEVKTFVYNNESQILFRDVETGETQDSVGDDNTPRPDTETEYFYANSNPVGQSEVEIDEDGNRSTDVLLDEGRYNLVREIGEDYPSTGPIAYKVQPGDTLESIADRLYGNPSLWFILAEANGLKGAERLDAGTILQIPNTVNTGRITDETHVVYNEGDITGSTLPNLKSPDPDACATILAVILIILIIIVAVVVAVVTAGAASAISGAIAAAGITGVAGTLLTIAAVAVVGAAIAFVGALVTQGLLIAFGVQDEIDWTSVAAESLAGAFAGIAAGIGAAVKVGVTAGKLASLGVKTARAIKVLAVAGAAVSDAGGEALRQYIVDGEITSFASIAGAAVGSGLATASVLRAASSGARAASKASALGRNIDDVTKVADKAAKVTAGRFDVVQAAAGVVTEWVKVAEIAARNEGEVTTADWATAIAGTVAAGLSVGVALTSISKADGVKFDSDGVFARNAFNNIAETSNPRLARAANAPDSIAAGIPRDVLRRNNIADGDLVPVTPRLRDAEARIANDTINIGSLNRSLDDANAQVNLSRTNLEAETASLNRANQRLTADELEFDVRSRSLDAADAQLTARRNALSDADDRLTALRRQADDAEQGLDPLRRNVADARNERDALRDNIAQFQGQSVRDRAAAFDAQGGIRGDGPVGSLQARLADTEARLTRQETLLREGTETVDGLQTQVTTQQRLAQTLRADADNQQAVVRRRTAAVESQRGVVDNQRQVRDQQQTVVNQARRQVTDGESRVRGLQNQLAAQNRSLATNTAARDRAVGDAVTQRDLIVASPFKLDPPGKGFREAAKDAALGDALDRGVDVVTTLVLLAAFDGDTAFGFLATGRIGKTNTGQSGRAALANAFSLSTQSNGRQIRVVSTPQPVSANYNTGPVQRSLVGVPVPEAEDPRDGLEQVAATIGRDEQTQIPLGTV